MLRPSFIYLDNLRHAKVDNTLFTDKSDLFKSLKANRDRNDYIPSRHKALTQCCIDVGPASETVGHYQYSIGSCLVSMSCVGWFISLP